ncbi:MAG: hypothetical protein ACFNMD_05150 [Prevotella sp.]
MIEKTDPYPTDLSDSLPAYALRFKGFDIDGNRAFHFEPLPAGTRLEANRPYLVQITAGRNHRLPVMHNAEVPVTPNVETSSVMATADTLRDE